MYRIQILIKILKFEEQIWKTSEISKNFFSLLSLFNSLRTNSIVLIKNIAVKTILNDKIIILTFFTPFEAITVFCFSGTDNFKYFTQQHIIRVFFTVI